MAARFDLLGAGIVNAAFCGKRRGMAVQKFTGLFLGHAAHFFSVEDTECKDIGCVSRRNGGKYLAECMASYTGRRQISSFVLTLRRLMSYIYEAPILDVSRSHTTTQHSR